MSSRLLGIGCISPCGNGVSAVREAWRQALRPQVTLEQIFFDRQQRTMPNLACGPFELSGAAALYRRLSLLGRMAIFATHAALDAAAIKPPPSSSDWGLIVSSGFGPESCAHKNLKQIYALPEGGGASPILFANSVSNSVASALIRSLAIHGPSVTIVEPGNLIAGPLQLAECWLNQKVVNHVVVVFGEENSPARNYAYLSRWRGQNFDPSLDASKVIAQIPAEGCLAMVLGADGPLSSNPRLELRKSGTDGADIWERLFLGGESLAARVSGWTKTVGAPSRVADVIGHMPMAPLYELAVVAASS